MKKQFSFLLLLTTALFAATAQNVGIGTPTPLYDLHVTKPAGNARMFLNTNGNNTSSALHLSVSGDMAELTKWSFDALGLTAGLPTAGIARLWNSNAGLLTGTGGAYPLHFATQNTERMRITGDGKLLLNTTGIPNAFDYQLNVNGGNRGAAIFLENPIVSANETVSIGRGVAASRFTRTSALHVIDSGDRAAIILSHLFEAVEATTLNENGYAAAKFTAAGATGQKLSVELDGFIKVSGNKTAFKHTTAAANISFNYSLLDYPSQSESDIVLITHNYSPTNTYLVKATGVFWNGLKWAIYTEDQSSMPANITFNVLVIKQ